MQQMAERGTLFQNAYCPAPLCLPCRSAFTSGLYPHQIQAYNNSTVNRPSGFLSWGQSLDQQGVHSVHVGKADAYDKIADLGFSETIVGGDRSFPGDTNQARKPLRIREGANARAKGYGVTEDPYKHDDIVIENALQWLKTKSPSLGKPFVLTINFLAPHFPHYTTQALWDKYEPHADLPSYGPDSETAKHPRAVEIRKHFEVENFSAADSRNLRRGYYACIDYVDQQLGRIRALLAKLGLDENTNLIYASDHGEMLGKFGMWWKCSLYEDSARIPIIAEGPDFNGGKTVRTPVNLLDVQAEFFASTGAKRPEHMVGEPLRSIKEDDLQRVCFSEYQGHGNSESSFMLRQGDWKLIYHIAAPHQLFNIKEDPDELENRFSEQPKIADALEKELRKICDPEKENQRTDDFVAQQLKRIEDESLKYSLYNQNIGEKPSP